MAAPVMEVRGVSKRFTRELRRSLRYAAADIGREVLARPAPEGGRALRRGEFAALDGVSFDLHAGDSLAVIGANGAGKSTLLKLLYGLIKPDAGEIRLRGRVAALIELGTGFDPVLTGLENIQVNGAILGVPPKRMRALTDAVVAFAELEHAIDAPVRTYSSGMVARLAFAVAAHVEPDVLLVDEVFAVGDIAFQRRCVNHMRSYLQGGGSLVLVSHNTPQIQSTCQRGLVLEQGQATFDGTVTDALARYFAIQEAAASESGALTDHREPSEKHPVVIDAVVARPETGEIARTGEPLHLEIAYRSLIASEVHWGFNVWTADGWICVTGSYDLSLRAIEPGAGSLRCTIPRLPLLNGRYGLKVSIIEASSLQALALHGYEDAPAVLVVEAPPSRLHNGSNGLDQLVTIDVDWN